MISLGTVTLTDPVGDHAPLSVCIYATEHHVFLQPAGYGEPEAAEGTGFPLFWISFQASSESSPSRTSTLPSR